MPFRLLVVDESLTTRLATQLKTRGRTATSVKELGFLGRKDPVLLPALADALEDQEWVLVTADDAMPEEHGALIADLQITVATVRPWLEGETPLTQEEYRREVVHRWAHRMAEQDQAEIRRYGLETHRVWTPRRR